MHVFTVGQRNTRVSSLKCTKILDIAKRREILKKRILVSCYNCATPGHRVSACRAQGCRKCRPRHHTSICSQNSASSMDEKKGEKGYAGIQRTDKHHQGDINKTLGNQGNQAMVEPWIVK